LIGRFVGHERRNSRDAKQPTTTKELNGRAHPRAADRWLAAASGMPSAILLVFEAGQRVSVEEGAISLPDEARNRIAAELAELRQRRERLLADLESDQDNVGDRGDSADELQLADQIAALDDRITELDGLLLGATADTAPGRLRDGTEVTLKYPDNHVEIMRVVSVVEEIWADQPADTLIADSPLGLALAGHKTGDTITYATPHGQQEVELAAVNFPA
jgi:transcription elongation GreA/GreB family factor